MARFTFFCMVVCVVAAVTSAQLTTQGGPLDTSGMMGRQPPNNAGAGKMFSNPLQAMMWSRFMDVNPLYAMMFGGGMNSGFLMPYLWLRNF
ncbi:hypothetical protein ACOMHN_012577 [Nucella lapillus]